MSPSTIILNYTQHTSNRINTPMLFIGLWVLMFALYFITAQAGFVTDFTGWLDQIRNQDFLTYVNRSNFVVVSLYQVTQVVTWLFYQLFGANAWLWHLLFITLHVANAVLLSKLVGNMLHDAGARHLNTAIYAGSVLFCVTPYISEVIVWEPSFHYLQGLLIILVILRLVQQYIYQPKAKYVWWVLILYLLSTHTLEVFYLTPWLVLSLLVFYKAISKQQVVLSKGSLYFVIPMLCIFVLRMVEFRLLHGDWVSRIGSQTVLGSSQGGYGKAGKYLFHLLFMGRFFSLEVREAVYAFCDGIWGRALVYGIGGVCLLWGIIRFNKLSGRLQVMVPLLLWLGMSLVLVVPMWFGDMMLVIFDRYAYFAAAFLLMLLPLLLWGIPDKYLRVGLLVVFMLVNLRYAIQVNRYWWKSQKVIAGLLDSPPVEKSKTTILLNNPESMHGVPMLGAWPQSEYQLMHNLLQPKPIKDEVYDVLAYNMLTPEDGAHVQVLNDSTLRVTLNQWGTWWWYEGVGGRSYENNEFVLDMVDGHFYNLTMKQPLNNYTFLYQVGDTWKVVDLHNKDEQW